MNFRPNPNTIIKSGSLARTIFFAPTGRHILKVNPRIQWNTLYDQYIDDPFFFYMNYWLHVLFWLFINQEIKMEFLSFR